MLPLRWTERAVAHLQAIVEYISVTSPVYAEGVVLRIEQRLQLTRAHTQLGKLAPDCLEVLAIVHERQHLPNAL